MGFFDLLVTDRLLYGLATCAGISMIAFVRSTWTGNSSFVDRMWSITPIIYTWTLADYSPRTILMSICITVWGIRLTGNFYRRGGYNKGEEDYRWPFVRSILTNKIAYAAFNFFFISLYQNFLLFSLCLPVYVCSLVTAPMTWIDFVLGGLLLTSIGLETLADQQQYDFQTEKYRLLETKRLEELPKPYSYGFCTTGLFKYSRHPNFFFEISNWYLVAFFAVAQDFQFFSICGAVLLNLLFLGSTALTEYLTGQKYPIYKKYQKSTSMLIPLPCKPMKE